MDPGLSEEKGVRIAVEGCGHGTLDAIYASVERACAVKGWPGVDLVIIGGDFQAVRNAYDLTCVSMPAKYREMHDFHQYYSGARTAPYLTVFVGGNHEASNYLFELYYGGWVAPNIYYMGAANVLRLGPLRIAGLSGIWKGFDYKKHHFERLPYSQDDIKSIYHVRELDVRKLLQIRSQVDVGISHDWPRGVEWRGDWKKLFRQKKFFEEDARNGQLGSVAAKLAMDRLRPPYWFSAHLHCKFAAIVDHDRQVDAQHSTPTVNSIPVRTSSTNGHGQPPTKESPTMNTDEIDLAMDDADPPVRNTDEIDLGIDDDDDDDDDDESAVTATTAVLPPPANGAVLPVNVDEIDLELEQDDSNSESASTATVAPGQGLDGAKVPLHDTTPSQPDPANSSAIPLAIRAQLPAAFNRPKPPPSAPPAESLPFPANITNKRTHFLALDKCLPNRDFLQLLSIPATVAARNDDDDIPAAASQLNRPLHLSYDKEWLAITRAFAPSLQLSSSSTTDSAHANARIGPDLGSAHYAPLIDAAARWVDAHVPDLAVPPNFSVTAPVYDPALGMTVAGIMPRECSNPQTAAFCAMLQLDNPFDVSEEERDGRMATGPRPEEPRRDGGGGGSGFGGGRGRGRGRGRGGFEGPGGGGGRGRNDGRGRGRGQGRERGRGRA
ncbi:hypothetical protein MBLNU459_g1925t1 [Dothideomycetes sp. NU459]